MLAGVKLKRRLCARDLEVQLGGGMRHADEGAQRQIARVEWDYVGRVEDEAVVEGRGVRSKDEGRVWGWGGGVLGDGAGGNRMRVKG